MILDFCGHTFPVRPRSVAQEERQHLKALAAEVKRRRKPTKLPAVRDELGPALFAEIEVELADETVVVRRGEIYAIPAYTYWSMLERLCARRQPQPRQLITSWWGRLTRGKTP